MQPLLNSSNLQLLVLQVQPSRCLLKLAKLAKLVILFLVSMVMCCTVSMASGNLKLLRAF